MDVVDDAQLIAMAAPKPHRMLRLLDRTESIRPVVLLLAVLPGLIVLESQPLDGQLPQWGLRAIDAMTATNVAEFVDPGRVGAAADLQFQPPLATWLTVAAMRVLGPSHPLSASIITYLSAAGVFGMAYIFVARLAGARAGFWTILLLASHPSGLSLFRAPAPVPLTLLLTLITLWAVARHRADAVSGVSLNLLIAGVALGLATLSGGPIVCAVLVILVAVPMLDFVLPSPPSAVPGRRRKRRPGKLFVPLITFSLTVFAVAGWWLLMNASGQGGSFWEPWFYGTTAGRGEVRGIDEALFKSFNTFTSEFGVMAVFVVVALCRALRELSPRAAATMNRSLTLPAIWAMVAMGLYVYREYSQAAATWHFSLTTNFLFLPMIALSGVLVDDILQRHVKLSFVVILAASCFASVIVLGQSENAENRSVVMRTVTSIAAVMAIVLASWSIFRWTSQNDHSQRLAISGMLVGLILTNLLLVPGTARENSQRDERELMSFMAGLSTDAEFDQCLLIASSQQPPRIEFAVRARWPAARFSAVRSWDSAFRGRAVDLIEGNRRTLVVEWMTAQEHPTKIDIPGFEITPVSSSRYYREKDLRAFRLRPGGASRSQ